MTTTCTHCKKVLHEATSRTHRCRAVRRPPRRKSCINCHAMKARCDPTASGCVRCEARCVECRFPEGLAPRIPQTVIEAPSFGPLPSPGQEQGLGYTTDNIDFGLILDEPVSTNILDIDILDIDILDIDILDIDILDVDILDVDISARSALAWNEINLDTLVQFKLPFLPLLEPTASGIVAMSSSLPWLPGHFLSSRFCEPDPRPVFRPAVVSLTERLMKTALRSYPNMVEAGGVPLIIHSTFAAHEDMKVALENCASMVLLWKSQRGFNKRFVSESLERERSRLLSEYGLYSEHGMLAATHAIIIYALLEYLDPDSTETHVGYRQMASLIEISHYAFRPGIVCHLELIGQRPKWEDWIMVESRRRCLVLLFLLDSFCELQKGKAVVVCPELIDMPLLSSRRLWEAPSREIWEAEYERMLKTEYGDLKLKDLWNETGGEKLDAWVAEMDVLGSTILAIAMSANELAGFNSR